MTHFLHHSGDPRFGTVDVILDATFDELNVADCSSAIVTAAKRTKRRIAVIQRQFGGTSYISYAPEDEATVGLNLIASLAATLGVPSIVSAPVVCSAYDRY